MNKMVKNLFEYQNKVSHEESFDKLEEFLDEIWKKRDRNMRDDYQEIGDSETQRFLQFIHKSKEIKSNKYVGVIHFEGQKINLLPKIFFDKSSKSDDDIQKIHLHILWWLSYCRKIKFPNYQTSLGGIKSDFFEILIYLFSKYTNDLLSNSVYQQYQEITDELSFVKGRIDMPNYITQNLSKGRWQKLNCTFDSFIIDNSFNRIVKHVANLLFRVTKSADNKRHLREILFILDDVSDTVATAEDCLKIRFNPFFGVFETVKDYCYLFLKNSVSLDFKNELKLFAFLLPMEYLFEDFIFGFIEKEIENVHVVPQVRSTYLDRSNAFLLKPDLYFEVDGRRIIADTKYKLIYSDLVDKKFGVSQNDLYQMLAYGVRFKVNELKLFYPDTIEEYTGVETEIIIEDAIANDIEICINTYQLPIINRHLFNTPLIPSDDLKSIFKDSTATLKRKLEVVLFNI